MQDERTDCLEMLEKASRKVKLARLAVDNGIDEGEGSIDFDTAEAVLMTLDETDGLLEKLRTSFSENLNPVEDVKPHPLIAACREIIETAETPLEVIKKMSFILYPDETKAT